MKSLPWPDEKLARQAKSEAVLHLRTLGYSWRQIGRAMNSTRGKVQCVHAKAARLQRKRECACPSTWRNPYLHHPECPQFAPG